MQKLSENNFVINHFAPTLEQIELKENIKLNELQKILLQTNRRKIADRILQIGTMIAFNKHCPKKSVNKMRFAFLSLMLLLSVNINAQSTWKANKKFIADTTKNNVHVHYQCIGTCKDSHRCKRNVKGANDYCYQHAYQK